MIRDCHETVVVEVRFKVVRPDLGSATQGLAVLFALKRPEIGAADK